MKFKISAVSGNVQKYFPEVKFPLIPVLELETLITAYYSDGEYGVVQTKNYVKSLEIWKKNIYKVSDEITKLSTKIFAECGYNLTLVAIDYDSQVIKKAKSLTDFNDLPLPFRNEWIEKIMGTKPPGFPDCNCERWAIQYEILRPDYSIEISNLEELVNLQKKMEIDLIIGSDGITIYNGYL